MSADLPVMPAGLSMTARRRFVRGLCKAHGYGRGFCKLVSDAPEDAPHDNVQITDWDATAPGLYCVWIGTTLGRGSGFNWMRHLNFRIDG